MMLTNPFSAAASQGTGMFGAANANVGAQPNPGPNGQQQQTNAVQNTPNQDTNFNVDNNNKQQLGPDGKPIKSNTENGDDSALKLDGLWDNEVNADGTPKVQEPDTGYLPKVDPVKFKEALSKIDFTKSITPELSAAINAGGEGAYAALQQILNTSSREVVATMFSTTQKMFESGMQNAKSKFAGDVDGRVKSIMVENQLTVSNPIMKDPIYGPMVDAVRQQFLSKYPKATPAQIEQGVNNYFDAAVEKMTTAKNNKNTTAPDNTQKLKTGDPTAEWDTWIGMGAETQQ